MMDIHKEKLMAKVENMAVTYEKYRLIPLDEIACDMWETDDHTLRSEPGNEAAWRPVHIGDPWGKEYGYAWFRGDLTVPASCKQKWLCKYSKCKTSCQHNYCRQRRHNHRKCHMN